MKETERLRKIIEEKRRLLEDNNEQWIKDEIKSDIETLEIILEKVEQAQQIKDALIKLTYYEVSEINWGGSEDKIRREDIEEARRILKQIA